jgi:hypothetical protein
VKPLERQREAEQVLRQSAGAEGPWETMRRTLERMKALKGEAQERWELKDASKELVS